MNSFSEFQERSKAKALNVWETTKKGFNESVWFFLVVSGGAVITKEFGLYGFSGTIITFGIFYGIGKFHTRINGKETVLKQEEKPEFKDLNVQS